MSRRRGGSFLWLLLLITSMHPGSVSAQKLSPSGKPEHEREHRAFEILAERGEIHIEFYPDDMAVVRKINSIISVDRKSENGFEAYANLSGFRAFLRLKIPYRIIEKQSGKKSAAAALEFPGSWDVYPTYNQYVSFMRDMARDYPGITRLDSIGESVDGRQILLMKISDNPDIRETEPAFVYSSSMHGDETTGYVLMLRLIEYLCSSYGKDSRLTRLVDSLEIWINPLANPDGTYWLGNDTVSLYKKRFNSNNADLNRNFPGIKGNAHPDGLDYQPENLVQMDFLRSIYMVMGANIHGGEEVINYPFDAWEFLHADNQWYMGISREYADTAQMMSAPVLYMKGFDNGITNGYEWYAVEGGRQDWINYFNYGREVTIEISLDKDPPPEDLPYYWHYNYPSMIRFMENSLYGIHGRIKDAETGHPLKASIHITGHDSLHSNIFSDPVTGFFARPVQAGTFDLEISLNGYQSEIIRGVEVLKDRTAWIEVDLSSGKTTLENRKGPDQMPAAYISGTNLNIPVSRPGLYRILLYDLKGRLVMEDQNFFDSEGIFRFSLGRATLRPGMYLLKIISSEGASTQKILQPE